MKNGLKFAARSFARGARRGRFSLTGPPSFAMMYRKGAPRAAHTFTAGDGWMKVAIIIGSDSDWPIMKPAAETLKRFGVEAEVTVASAHRTPARVEAFVRGAEERGVGAFIAAAGGAAHLAGVVASHTVRPVIGVPVNATPLGGMDALLATVQMPSGIPVATMAVNGAKNAALFAVSALAAGEPALLEKLRAYREELAKEVEKKAALVAAQA